MVTKSRNAYIASVALMAGAACVLAGCEQHSSAASGAATTAIGATVATGSIGSSASVAAGAAATSAKTSAPKAASGGGAVSVCSLLTSAQASSINKVTYGATTPQHVASGYDMCEYANTGSVDPVDIQDLTTDVMTLPDCYNEERQADGPGTEVSGIGDDAFGYSIGIVVKVGDRCIGVSGLTDAEFRDNYAPDVAMAKIIISHLS
ncbi:MAG: hypothetical protein ACRDV3_08025 [Acidothermaceae bacterium]